MVELRGSERDLGSAAFVQWVLRELRTRATSQPIGSMFRPMRDRIPEELPTHLLFYDGVCAMCNGIVKAVLRADRDERVYFAPLQGETAERARRAYPEFPAALETVVFLRDGEVFLRSRAAALAMAELPYPMRALSWVRVLPAWFTDFFYGLVARIRYRVFGRYDTCPLPPAAHRARFLP